MASEIPDGSSDGDPNKNPQELEKKLGEEEVENQNERAEEEEVEDQNEKPEEEEEEVENQIKKPEEDEVNGKDYFGSLGIDATEVCLAYVSKCDYPAISMASTAFGRLIASPKLYITRSQLDAAERFLYVLIAFPPHTLPRWYILYQSSNDINLRLRRIDSLPTMPFGSAVVTVGTEIYVIGGCDGERITSDVILIDCKTHTCDRSLPRMNVARLGAAAGIIDGKIYVIGGCEKRDSGWIEVFDLNTKTWSRLMGTVNKTEEFFLTDVVMEEKIYTLDHHRCHFFDHKELKWSAMDVGCPLHLFWRESSCVMDDDRLYTIFPLDPPDHSKIDVYNPKTGEWRFVDLGESQELMPPQLIYADSKMANFGGKLVILATNRSWSSSCDGENEIWCFKIAFEERRHQDGEIRGTVESADIVLRTKESPPSILLCRTLTM